MVWQTKLNELESKKAWDESIDYLAVEVKTEPNRLEKYLCLNYLLMNLLVEEDYDEVKQDFYVNSLKAFFSESYLHFSKSPKYLFYTAFTASMSEWFFGIEIQEVYNMLQKAFSLAPENKLFQWGFNRFIKQEKEISRQLAEEVLKDKNIVSELNSLGALGEHVKTLLKGSL